MDRRLAWRVFPVAALVLACGDAPTTDTGRGYTKAPLEKAGLFPTAESRSPVSQFGQTNRPRPEILTLPDTTRPAGN
jgi:hypothetical protein